MTVLGPLMVAGCLLNNPNAVRYTPEQGGVVIEEQTSATPHYTLEGGREVAVADGTWISGSPVTGDLLLVGTSPAPWAYSVRPAPSGGSWPPGCYSLRGATWDRGGSVEVLITVGADDAYLRVSKAPTFTAETASDGRLLGNGALCLDGQGRAFAAVR